ncbi:MAG: lipid hydroperoxide peroxidase [Chlamydiae bacterium RIFCSPHIGHO2_12_FULL_49_9]|nr:MAG: lipid hydroperoxide peroxidase [Chlamydiae bacterium RIFCSPHIGHO2_12_FULL_49_9]
MAQITLKGNPIHTKGNLPPLHTRAPDFHLVDKDLNNKALRDFQGKKMLIATAPSLDTGVCSLMAKHLNEWVKKHPDVVILFVSADLPFAQKRFCEKENVHNVHILSMMRDKSFGETYGLLIQDGPLAGILARSIIALDEKGHVLYTELVPEIAQEPNYKKAIDALKVS